MFDKINCDVDLLREILRTFVHDDIRYLILGSVRLSQRREVKCKETELNYNFPLTVFKLDAILSGKKYVDNSIQYHWISYGNRSLLTARFIYI